MKSYAFFHRSGILWYDRNCKTTLMDPQLIWRVGIQVRSSTLMCRQPRCYIPHFKSCSRRPYEACSDDRTLHTRIGRVWRDQTLLRSYRSAIRWYLYKELGQTEIRRWKKGTSTYTLQTIITFPARRSVENPGISYSDILILIPDSRTVYDLIFTLFILLTLSR